MDLVKRQRWSLKKKRIPMSEDGSTIIMIDDSNFMPINEYNKAEVAAQRAIYLSILTLTKWTGYWLVPFLVIAGLT